MVAAVRSGAAQRVVARRLGIGLGHLQYWLARTCGQHWDRVDWSDQSTAPRAHGRQTRDSVQRRVLALRRELRQGDLGFVGAQAIRDALGAERPHGPLPSLRRSDGFSNDTARWTQCGGCAGARRPQAGIFRTWQRARRNWMPSMSSRTYRWKADPGWMCSRPGRCGGRCAALGSAPRCGRAGSANGWKRTGERTAARLMHSSTTTRVSRERTPIRTCWGKSSGSACRWASPRCSPRRANMDRKTSTKVSIICGSKRSGSVSTTPTPWPSKPAVIASWRLISDGVRHGTTARPPGDPSPKHGRWTCTGDHAAWSSICGAQMNLGRSGCWAIVWKWTPSGCIGWCGPRWIWTRTKSAATGCADARRTNSRSFEPSNMCFPINSFIRPDLELLTPPFWHFH